eukprot:CAMPEP_0119518752 /NCGR_PEP_ID=MMETSP1344-20130328/35276_1 /TAXON_ID=236787 /ORGANISM="Florenciella parvula, Strain CCMP2471" /LENGTH=31 /DNA_ID= /DNA_START= /DNA_END= /DNA_ORIENTATION=
MIIGKMQDRRCLALFLGRPMDTILRALQLPL